MGLQSKEYMSMESEKYTMENNDRHFIRQRLGQQFTMDGPVLDDDGRISHRRFNFGTQAHECFDTQTHECFRENLKLFSLFKDQFAGLNVALYSYKGQCRVVCKSGSFWGSEFCDYPFHLKAGDVYEHLRQSSTVFVAFDVTGMGTVEIIQLSIKKCQILATLFDDLRAARI